MNTVFAEKLPRGPAGRVSAALCAIFTGSVGLLMITSGISAAQTGARNTLSSDAGRVGGVVLQQRSRWIQPPPLDVRFASPRSPDRPSGPVSTLRVDVDTTSELTALEDTLAVPASTVTPRQQMDIVEAGFKPIAETAAIREAEAEADQNPDTFTDAAIRVVIHSNSTAGDIHKLFAETLEAREQLELVQREVDFAITRHQVRFFHSSDLLTGRVVTDALIEKLRDFQGRNAERIILRDFTHYNPGPEPGTLEIWVH